MISSVKKPATLLLGGLILGLFHSVSSASAPAIDYVDASFSLEYNNKASQGENRLRVQHDQDQYQVRFSLDHWMTKSEQSASFKLTDCAIQPLSYQATNKRPLQSETKQTLSFDWEQNIALYRSDEDQQRFDLESVLYDPLSFFFEARCDLIDGKTEFSYPVIHKGKIKTHTYKMIGSELVNTAQGKFNALVIERQRSNKNRKTRLYVAPELDYLLVKIEHQESRLVNVVATLKHMDYRLLNR